MGYIRDHAIVVTGCYGEYLDNAHAEATKIFRAVTPIVEGGTNNSRSFLVPPDGSKEGWNESNAGDERRDQFIAYLRSLRYADGSSPLAWVEVRVSDDDNQLKIERSYTESEDV